MEYSIKKSLRSTIAVVLILAMQLPAVAKISHAVFDHIDIECNDYGSLHLHKVELECEFQKYNLSTNCIIPDFQKKGLELLTIQEKNFPLYSFLGKYQKLHFSLRGPPAIS